jgi:glycosyltransferase involved in cell wall biosynthesis
MSKEKVSVCIVIPAYNESSVVGAVIENILKTLSASKYSYEVVVVDDGSTDNTSEIAFDSGATVVRHILNSGAGAATATGLSYALQNDFTIAATMDADGQHSAKDVLRGIVEIEKKKADLLIGSRLIRSDGMSKIKVLGNRGLSAITFLIFGINSTDSQSGLRIFSRKSLEKLKWKTSGYEFCSEMLWRAKQQKLKIEEYPIQAIYTEYSIAKGQNNWNAINIIKSLVKRRLSELFG